MPTIFPDELSSGPPESPGSRVVFVSINPLRCSLPPWSSLTVIACETPVTSPEAEVSVPVPFALPIAVTA